MGTVQIIAMVAATFVCMEAVAWAVHKFVMHGFLWRLHKDHHQHVPGRVVERNDAFFLIFALPSMALFLLGTIRGFREPWFWIGLGMLLYGVAYFLVHDVLIHRRIKGLRHSNAVYFTTLRHAHAAHHKHGGKEEGECFGMLMVPFKFFQAALKERRAAKQG